MRSSWQTGLAILTALLLFSIVPLLAAFPDLLPADRASQPGIPPVVWLVPAILALLVALIWTAGRERPTQ